VRRLARRLGGGSDGNEQLTAVVATLLTVLLVVEGATLLSLSSLLTVHAFVGVLLVPVVAAKLASTGWRALRYYLGAEEYVGRGPPHVALRVLVAPVLVASTACLLGTGLALLALDRTEGPLVGLHKASFVVWLGATGVHVLTRLAPLVRALRHRPPATGMRIAVAAFALAAGLAVATLTLPAADRLQDALSSQVGFDER
jgi:hypothetical protein